MTSPPIFIGAVQLHRRLGVSTFAYFLGREIASMGVHVVVADGTTRPYRLHELWAQDHPHGQPSEGFPAGLNRWVIPDPYAEPLSVRLERGRREGLGRVSLVILDLDATLFQHFNEPDPCLDYAFILTSSASERQVAEQFARQVAGSKPPLDSVGLVIARVNPAEVRESATQRTPLVPVVGALPADYHLAGGTEYSAMGLKPAFPRAPYLDAVHGLAEIVVRKFPSL